MNQSPAGRRFLLLFQCLLFTALLSSCSLFFSPATDGEAEKTVAIQRAGSLLKIDWVRDVDQRRPASASGYSLPVVTADKIVICGEDSRVHIFNFYGNEQARLALQAPCESGALALANGLVSLIDTNGVIYGIDAEKATILWKHELSSSVLGHPKVIDGDILVQTADNNLYRFSSSGEKKWSYSGGAEGLTVHAGSSPAVFGANIFAVFTNGDVVALRGESGDLLWRQQLYLSNNAVAFNEIRAPIAAPAIAGEVLIVSFFQGDIFAMSSRDGQQLWSRPISLKGKPLAAGTRLYTADSMGNVYAMDVDSGQTIWKQKVSGAELVGPVAWKGGLVVAGSDGRIVALDLQGKVISELTVPGRIDRSPVVFSGGILVRTDLGRLYLLH